MDELDKKLKEIKITVVTTSEQLPAYQVGQLPGESIEKIRKAFIDAGWQQVGVTVTIVEKVVDHHEYVGANGGSNVPLMTGQEWYDSFIKEKHRYLISYPHSKEKDWINNAVESAAKKAAGIA